MSTQMAEDSWFLERYADALWADHEASHPDRQTPVATCWYCAGADT